MAAAARLISVLIDQLFLVCGLLCKFMTCLLCLTKNSCGIFGLSYAIFSSPAMFFDGGEAPCYLDCCSICITTIIICMYLISIVISFIWLTGFFFSLLWYNTLNKKSSFYPALWQKHELRLSVTKTKEGPHILKLVAVDYNLISACDKVIWVRKCEF